MDIQPEDGGVTVNGIAVTTPAWYPTPDVLSRLGVSKRLATTWRKKNFQVVSVGEGAGGLLPWLVEMGVKAKGVDLWYGSAHPFPKNQIGAEMKRYQDLYKAHLIGGNAFSLPFKTDSVDIVLSNKLINNFVKPEERLNFISEVLRVLKSGGEARIDFVDGHQATMLFDSLETRFPAAKIFEENEEGIVGSVGLLPAAGFQIIHDGSTGVLFVKKRKSFAELSSTRR